MQTRFIGYGAMLMECFVAIMALIAACVLQPGAYFAMNAPAGLIGTTAQRSGADDHRLGLRHHARTSSRRSHRTWARTTILSRAGGAPTLAVGMAQILSGIIGGKTLMAFWYHFAILFEALFILTTVDAGTRVARFMIQDLLGVCDSGDEEDPVLGRQPHRDRLLRSRAGATSSTRA